VVARKGVSGFLLIFDGGGSDSGFGDVRGDGEGSLLVLNNCIMEN